MIGRKPRAIFIENVKNMVGHDHGNTFKVIREALTGEQLLLSSGRSSTGKTMEISSKP